MTSSTDKTKNKLVDSMRLSKEGSSPASAPAEPAATKPAEAPAAKKAAPKKAKPKAASKPKATQPAAENSDPFQSSRRVWPD